jgi:hypothetical protein
MMKKILAIFLFWVSVFSLGGCSRTKVDENIQSSSMFVVVERSDMWRIVYHKETKVMYAVSSYYSDNCGNFTLLVNADGTPMLWEGNEV